MSSQMFREIEFAIFPCRPIGSAALLINPDLECDRVELTRRVREAGFEIDQIEVGDGLEVETDRLQRVVLEDDEFAVVQAVDGGFLGRLPAVRFRIGRAAGDGGDIHWERSGRFSW